MFERLAIVAMTPGAAGKAICLIQDHGLEVVSSLAAEGGKFAILIRGDALPGACADPRTLRQVRLVVQVEAYGRQRLERIVKIELAE